MPDFFKDVAEDHASEEEEEETVAESELKVDPNPDSTTTENGLIWRIMMTMIMKTKKRIKIIKQSGLELFPKLKVLKKCRTVEMIMTMMAMIMKTKTRIKTRNLSGLELVPKLEVLKTGEQ